MGIIDTATKELLPWRSQLWDTNLGRVGGVTRIYAARHRARRLLLRRRQRIGWRRAADQRHRDRVPARRRVAPELRRPAAVDRPALRQHLLGGDHRVRRSTSAATSGSSSRRPPTTRGPASTTSATAPVRAWPATASATRWSAATTSRRSTRPTARRSSGNPTGGSNSFEGDKAMEATSRGLFVGGDGMFKGGVRTGRVAFYDFNTVTVPGGAARHHDHHPDRGPGRRRTTRRSTSPAPPG